MNLSNNEYLEIEYQQKKIIKKTTNYVYTNVFIINLHIFLLSIFEPVFYFNYVTKLEKQYFFTNINNYLNLLKFNLNKITNITDNNLKNLIKELISEIKLENETHNNTFTKLAIIYSSVIFSILILQFFIGKYFLVKLNWKSIILDNVLMIFLLGLYEYVFFITIIIQDTPISEPEINNYILLKLDNFLNNP